MCLHNIDKKGEEDPVVEVEECWPKGRIQTKFLENWKQTEGVQELW